MLETHLKLPMTLVEARNNADEAPNGAGDVVEAPNNAEDAVEAPNNAEDAVEAPNNTVKAPNDAGYIFPQNAQTTVTFYFQFSHAIDFSLISK